MFVEEKLKNLHKIIIEVTDNKNRRNFIIDNE